MPALNRWFIIPSLGLSQAERASLEDDVLGTFQPDTQRYSLDGSKYVIGYIPTTGTPQCLQQYNEYTYQEILVEMNSNEWSMPF
jgi:hypothetical protein